VTTIITKDAIRDLVRDLLGEGKDDPDPAVVVEPPVQELPVDPNPEIGTDGVFELPPVNDPDYKPGTTQELSKAAYAVTQEIPSHLVTQFWKELDRLSAEAETWQEDEAMKTPQMEENLRQQIRKIIREVDWSAPDTRYRDPDEPEEWEKPDVPDTSPGERGHESTWEEIADILAFRSPSGAKQMVDDPGRLMDKTRFLLRLIMYTPGKFEELRKSAVEEYANALLKSDAIDEEDAEFLKAHPEHTATLDSYRIFLKKFIMRAMKKDPEIQAHIQKRREQKAAVRAANKARREAKKKQKAAKKD